MGATRIPFLILTLNFLCFTLGQVNNEICSIKSKQINAVKGLPRFNKKGGLGVSGNWGDYPIYTCTNGTNGKTCSWVNFPGDILHNSEYQDYVTSVLFYPGFAIFMCVLTFLIGICLGIGRYLCCCVEGGLCGKRYPTKKTKFCCFNWGILGYVPIRTADGQNDFGYPLKWRWANRGFMLLFLFFVLLWIGLGHFQGNEALTSAMVSVADSPTTLVNTVTGTVPVLAEFAENIVGNNVVNFLKGFNQTFNSACDINIVLNQIDCVINEVDALPGLNETRQFVIDQLNQITNTTNITIAVNSAFALLSSQENSIQNTSNHAVNITKDAEQKIAGIQSGVNNTIYTPPDFTQFMALETDLFNNTGGVNSVVSDLEVMDSQAPLNTDLNTAVNDLNQILVNGDVSTSRIQQTVTALQTIRNGYFNMPNFTTTASNMQTLNGKLTNFQNSKIITQIVGRMDSTQALLNAFVAADYPTQFQDTINDLIAQVHNISWNSLYDIINMAEEQVKNGINSTIFNNQVQSILNITSIVPCVNTFIGQITNINTTLVTFPSSVNDAFNQLDDLNNTLNQFVDQVNNFTSSLDAQVNQALSINFTDIFSQIQTMQNEANTQADAVNTSSIIQNLTIATNYCRVPDYTTLRAALIQLNDTIFNSTIPTGVITATQNLEAQIIIIKANIDSAISDLGNATRGFCAANTNVPCDTFANCPSNGACDTAQPTTRCKTDQSQQCANIDDGQCPGSTKCLVSKQTLQPLHDALVQSGTLIDTIRPQKTIEETLQRSYVSQTLISLYTGELVAANISVGLVNSPEFQSQLDSLTSAFDIFNITAAQDQFNDLLSKLDNLDLSSILDQIDSLNGTFDQLDQSKVELNRTRRLANTSREFLFVKGPVWLDELSTQTLAAIRGPDAAGIVNEFLHVTNLLDEMIQFYNDGQDLFDNITENVTDQTGRIREYLTAVTDPRYTEQGPFHFFWALKDVIEETNTTIFPGQNEDQIFNDADGHRYPNGSYCLTSKCIKKTIEYYNNQPIGNLLTEANLGLPSILNIPMSRVQLVSAPYLYPFFTAIFGMFAASLIFPGHLSDLTSTICASFSACLIFCSMPWMFLLAGSFFILPLLGGDACLSIENVGYQYVNGRGDEICSDFSGDGTITNCNYNLSTSDLSYPFTLNYLEMYTDILGGCGGNDPFATVYSNATHLANTYVPSKLYNEFDTNVLQNAGVEFKQPVLDLVNNLTIGIGNSTAIFFTSLHSQVGCNNLHSVYADAKSAFCCDVMTSVYWMISSWYLIGWTFLCCGCGASLLGRKRFPNELWGPDIVKDRIALAEDHDSPQAAQQPGEEFEEGPHGGFHEAPQVDNDGLELDSLKSPGDRVHGSSMQSLGQTPQGFETNGGSFDISDPVKDQNQGDWRVS